MFKIAILGCENSHADGFLKAIRDEKLEDIQVMGVYSCFPGEAEDLHETFGVPVMENYDDLVGQLDGLIITARHGANHYKYAKPYLNDGIPLFIDKPITVTEEDARAFFKDLVTRGIPVCGGSSLKHAQYIQELKQLVASGEKGKVMGGFFRMPLDINSEHGGFYFYAQHLVQSVCEVFGYYPKAVRACRSGDQISCIFRYEDFDVTGLFVNQDYCYYASVHFPKTTEGSMLTLGNVTAKEFHDFYDLLQGKPQTQSCGDLFAPVFIMNAIDRALQSGQEEPVHKM